MYAETVSTLSVGSSVKEIGTRFDLLIKVLSVTVE